MFYNEEFNQTVLYLNSDEMIHPWLPAYSSGVFCNNVPVWTWRVLPHGYLFKGASTPIPYIVKDIKFHGGFCPIGKKCGTYILHYM